MATSMIVTSALTVSSVAKVYISPKLSPEENCQANLNPGRHGSTEHKKPGLMDKLNPKKDADGDGKAGFMK
jgi:hypothetical protein